VGDAGDGVAEGDVGEAPDDVLNVRAVFSGIGVVLFDEGAAGNLTVRQHYTRWCGESPAKF